MSMLVVLWTLVAVIIAGVIGILAMMRSEFGGLRTEMKTEIGGLRGEISGLRSEMKTEIGEVRSEISGLSDRIQELSERQAEMTGQLTILRDMAHTH